MTIMDVIKKISGNKSETKQKFKQMQEDDRLNTMLEERKKSSNQRELEKYMKNQQEQEIKNELDKIHKKQNQDNWKGTTLTKGASILKNDNPILKQKNIFKNQGNMFLDNKSDIPFVNNGGYFR